MSSIMLLASETELQNLTGAGAAVMATCIGLVLALCAFCFWRILREPAPSEHHHAPLDIDTHDFDG